MRKSQQIALPLPHAPDHLFKVSDMFKTQHINRFPNADRVAEDSVTQTNIVCQDSNRQKEHSPIGIIIQPKLTVGATDDPFEREADAVAEQVMRMPNQNFAQRKCAHGDEEAQRKLLTASTTPFVQTKRKATATVSDGVASSIQSTRGNGSSLDSQTQSFMSSRMGSDFSNVKIHNDSQSAQLNQNLSAKAFTIGNDIYFNRGQYQPQSAQGKQLLAHELAHVLQQNHTQNNIIQKHDDPSEWCGPFKQLIDYEARYGRLWVLYRYNSFTTGIFGEETLIPLNYNIPSILGDVDVDWMFRLAVTQYAFSISGKFAPGLSDDLAAQSSVNGLRILKGTWNTIRAPFPQWNWEYESIREEGNWNASTAINKWMMGVGTLKDLFKPAVDLCEKP